MFTRAFHYLHSVLFPTRHRMQALEELETLEGDVDVSYRYMQLWYPYFMFDEEFKIALLKKDGMALKYYPEYRHSRSLVLEAVRTSGLAIQYAPDFHDDWEIIFEAVNNEIRAYDYASKKLRGDDLIMSSVLEQDADMLNRLPIDDHTFGLVVQASSMLEIRPPPPSYYMFNDRVQALATAIYKCRRQQKTWTSVQPH